MTLAARRLTLMPSRAEPAPEYVSISVYERKGEGERAIKRRKRRSYEFWRQKRNVIKKSGKERENGAGRGGGRKKKRKKKKEKEEEEEEKDGKKRERETEDRHWQKA